MVDRENLTTEVNIMSQFHSVLVQQSERMSFTRREIYANVTSPRSQRFLGCVINTSTNNQP